MFLATTNPSVCKVTRQLPSRTILNDGKFYTFDNGSCTLYTETGFLNTTDAGAGSYYYFQNNNGCGSGVANDFLGGEWSNLNSWCCLNGELPELLPIYLSNICYPHGRNASITSNTGSVPIINTLRLASFSANYITICALSSICFATFNSNYGCLISDGNINFTAIHSCGNKPGGIIESRKNGSITITQGTNCGTIINTGGITCFFNCSCNLGTVYGTVIFDPIFSLNAYNSGNISGIAYFNNTAQFCIFRNFGVISGNAYFDNKTYNFGTVCGTGYFKNLACNSGTVTCACLY